VCLAWVPEGEFTICRGVARPITRSWKEVERQQQLSSVHILLALVIIYEKYDYASDLCRWYCVCPVPTSETMLIAVMTRNCSRFHSKKNVMISNFAFENISFCMIVSFMIIDYWIQGFGFQSLLCNYDKIIKYVNFAEHYKDKT